MFSIQRKAKIGSGATARRVEQTGYYYAEERPDGVIEMQGLSDAHLPVGPKIEINKEDLLRDYMPEPGVYQKDVLPKLREIQKAVARGDKFRKRGETFTAEFEYSKALSIDEQNVRANFGIGICYLQRGDSKKAHEVFERVVKIDAAFEKEHKHLFNEFGINLRKGRMFDEAVDYYKRALALTQDDENLFYNLARAYYEKGEPAKAAENLKTCLTMNPGHEEGKAFLDHLKAKKLA